MHITNYCTQHAIPAYTAYTAEEANGLCADGINTNRTACEQSGMNDYLNKPVSLDILQQVMHQYLPGVVAPPTKAFCATDALWQSSAAVHLQTLLSDASAANVSAHQQRIKREKSESLLSAKPPVGASDDISSNVYRRRMSMEELPSMATGLQLWGLQP